LSVRPESARALRWSDLRKRVISAAILAPLALACLWLGAWPWTVLIALAAGGLAGEWSQLCGVRATSFPGLAVPIVVLAAGAVAVAGQELAALVLLAAAFAGIAAATSRPAFAAGTLYVGLATVSLIWLRGDTEAGRSNVLFMVLIVWASDIGAYLVGRFLGGPKLAPSISPGKTWSGAAGGLVAAMLVGLAAAQVLSPSTLAHVLPIAAALGIISQLGDLLESAIKRHFGVKDSSRLIPGHGGLLDRLDGILAAAPGAALLAMLLGRGVVLWR
jgi:phosphatidate cytidylyltransferase